MISRAKFFRGAIENTTFTGTVPLNPASALCWRVQGTSTPIMTLPDATTLIPDLQARIWNVTGGDTITFKDSAGGTIGTIAAGAGGALTLYGNATAAGVWNLKAQTLL